MRALHLVMLFSLASMAACSGQKNVCEAPSARSGIVSSFTSDKSSLGFSLVSNLQLKEIKIVKKDESTGTTDCQARVVVPTEHGPLDGPIRFRMGPASGTDEQVFMYAFGDKSLEQLWDSIELAAKKGSAQKM